LCPAREAAGWKQDSKINAIGGAAHEAKKAFRDGGEIGAVKKKTQSKTSSIATGKGHTEREGLKKRGKKVVRGMSRHATKIKGKLGEGVKGCRQDYRDPEILTRAGDIRCPVLCEEGDSGMQGGKTKKAVKKRSVGGLRGKNGDVTERKK